MKFIPTRNSGTFEFLRESVSYQDVLERFTEVDGDRAFCPIQEQTSNSPAFHLYEDGVAHCFSCGFHGDVTKFWQTIKALASPWDAAQDLAREFNLTLPEIDPAARERHEKRRRMEDDHATVAAARNEALKTDKGRAARGYLEGRGFGPVLQDRFKFGVTPDGHLNIPFWVGSQIHGQVIRRLDGREPKYKAPRKEDFPLGRRPLCMTGAPRAVEYLLVEGYLDQPAAEAMGIPCIGSGGSMPSKEQIRDLLDIAEKGATFVIVPDNDKAGDEGAKRTVEVLYPYARLSSPLPGDGIKDVADLFKAQGTEATDAIREIMVGAKDALELALEDLPNGGRAKVLYLKDRIAPLLLQLPSESERQAVIKDVAKAADLTKEIVSKALVEVQALTVKPADEPEEEEIPEEEYAELLEPGVLERYTEAACKVKGVVGGEDKTVVKLSTLIATGAQLDLLPNGRPVAGSLMLTGEAGRGKNYLCDAAVSLLPGEWYEAFEAASATVFYYLVELKPDYLKHKFVYPNEAEAVDTVVEFLRPMLSQGRAKKLTVNKNGDGTNVAQELIVEGPVTGVIPTVRNKLDDQLQTRMLVAELEGYDGRIKAHTAALSKLLSPNRPETFDTGVGPRWKAALGSLTGVRRVVIDFADRDEFRLSNEDVSHGARLWQNVLGLMCTHAWLEQRNREIRELADGTSSVVATAEDYKAAYEVFKVACKRSVVNLSDTHRQIVEAVYELRKEATFDEDGFSTKQVADKAGVAKSTVSKNRAYLVMSVGLLYETKDKRLNISKDAEPSWWATGDAMMGFPSPETVEAWEGYTPSGPPGQGNTETVGQKPHTYAAEPVSHPGKPQETRETDEETADRKPRRNGEYSENGQGNAPDETPLSDMLKPGESATLEELRKRRVLETTPESGGSAGSDDEPEDDAEWEVF